MEDTQNPQGNQEPQGQPSTVVEGQAPATQEETNGFDSKYAAMARREKAFRAEQRRFQAERDAWKAERDAERARIEGEIYGRFDKDPVGSLSQRGITPDQLTSLLVNQNDPNANFIFQVQQENKELRQQIDAINKRFEDNDRGAYEQGLRQIGHDAQTLIKSNPNDYEMVGLAGDDGIEAIKALCKAYWEEDKVLISVREAAEMVEQEYLENAVRLANSNKVKTKLTPAQAAAKAAADATKTPQQTGKIQPTKTLNSQVTQQISQPVTDRVKRAKLVAAGINPDTGVPFGKS